MNTTHKSICFSVALIAAVAMTKTQAQTVDTRPIRIEGSAPSDAAAAGQDDDATSRPSVDTAGPTADGQKAAGAEDLAKKLQNPIADLISVPIQFNLNFGGGQDVPGKDRDQALRYLLNVQPVIPFNLTDNWNLISRTILPVLYQSDVLGDSDQGGLGDTIQSFFLSPRSTKPFIWGAGPVFLLPTATDDSLGGGRWGMGPTGVILKQTGPWTYGILANHLWSFARDDAQKETNATFLQPFCSYTFKTATSIVVNTESTYDWIDDQWTVPLFAGVSQLVKIGKMPVQFTLGGQYWVEGPTTAPDWSMRFAVTFLLPK